MANLWVIGPSFCLPYNINGPGWANLVAAKLKRNLINRAQLGADNFYVYHSYLENLPSMSSDDVVIVMWSHFSRKSFVVEDDNVEQQNAKPQSLIYKTKTKELMRSLNTSSHSLTKFLNFKPIQSGKKYYDIWFSNYYSAYEQQCNQQSYMDSIELTCPGVYLPLYFSNESIENLRVAPGSISALDFIQKHKVMISDQDAHFNEQGHALWADEVFGLLAAKMINN